MTEHDQQFRDMAVKLALTRRNRAELARQLGVPYTLLRSWLKSHYRRLERAQRVLLDNPIHQELEATKKELDHYKEQVEILKKAMAYFARSQQ